MAVSPELMPPELQEKMVAAFEHARAERLAAQIPQDGAGQAGDPWTRANTAAFLILEREHRAIAARLCRPYRRRGDRYRDLVLVTKLIRVEYEHLAGRVGETAGPPAPPNGALLAVTCPQAGLGPGAPGRWSRSARRSSFTQDQRDRLATRLSARTLASAAADAEQHRDRILSRFERAMGEWRLELEHGRAAAADSGKREAARPTAEAAGQKRAWPWASLRFTRPAAAVAAVFVAVGVGTILAETRGGGSPVGAPSAVVASVPEPCRPWASGRGAAAGPRPRRAARRGPQVEGSPAGPGQRSRPGRADRVGDTASPARACSRSAARSGRPSRSRRQPRSRAAAPSRRRARPEAPTRPEASARARLLPCRPPAAPCPPPAAPETGEVDLRWRESPPGHRCCRRGPGAGRGSGGARRPDSGRAGRRGCVYRAG